MHRPNPKHDRGGFALPVAVLALVVVGVLVTAGFYMAQQESRIGIASKNSSMAFYIAEQGMNEVLADWSAATYSVIPLWDSLEVTGSIDQGNYTVKVHHLTERMYWIESEGTVTEGGRYAGATRKAGVIAKIRTAWIDPPAALTTRGDVVVGGNAVVDGHDEDPNGWGSLCTDVDHDDKPGVIHDENGSATEQGNASEIDGEPASEMDPDLDAEDFVDFGDLQWEDLVELASITLSSSTTSLTGILPTTDGSGACDSSNDRNWGEPYTASSTMPGGTTRVPACESYFPLIHHPGPNLSIRMNRGQGILLVGTVTRDADGNIATMSGNLTINGNFVFNGIIIVMGAFNVAAGNRPSITGGVMAANANIENCTGASCTESLLGTSLVQYSQCGVQRAILNNSALAKARPIVERSWVDLSNVSHE